MSRTFLTTLLLFLAVNSAAGQQSSPSQTDGGKPPSQSPAPPQSPGAQPSANPAAKDKDKPPADKKKPKKVWTDDDVKSVGGDVSVVGDTSPSSSSKSSSDTRDPNQQAREQQVATLRNQLHQLQAQLGSIDKKIDELRNFKADNTSSSGGINPRHGYSMTPVEDQVKQLETRRKNVQAQIDELEDAARKIGIEPGELR
jgi:chaperonin cofactor prefoldin